MKKNILIWLLGILVFSAVGIFLLHKASLVEVPDMGAENWMELNALETKYKFAGIFCLTGGNLFYSGICLAIFMMQPKTRAAFAKYVINKQKKFQQAVDEETYKDMQDVAAWNIEVHQKGVENISSNLIKDEQNIKEVIKVRCPECGALNDEEAVFCNKCGVKIK